MINKQPASESRAVYNLNKAWAESRGNIVVRSLSARTERDRLIESQLWKAKKIARFFVSKTGLRYDDLHAAACECIMLAYESWNPEKGANFSTYLNRSLHFRMYNYLRDFGFTMKYNRKMHLDRLKLEKAKRQNPHVSGKKLAELTGFTADYVAELEEAFRVVLSLDYPENNDEENY